MQSASPVSHLVFQSLSAFDEISHFCTTRNGGVSTGNYASLNLSPFTGDNLHFQQHNLFSLSETIGVQSDRLVMPFQNHGDKIVAINESYFQLNASQQQQMLHGVNAIVTNNPGICIAVTTADCVPLLFYDPKRKVVAAVHAGWRGTCAKLASKTILYLQNNYQSNPADIRVAIGPSISVQAYQVGEELFDEFSEAGFPVQDIFEQRDGALFLDLWNANKWQLIQQGVLEQHVELSGICTYSQHEKFYSARRLGLKSGRFLSAIMLK